MYSARPCDRNVDVSMMVPDKVRNSHNQRIVAVMRVMNVVEMKWVFLTLIYWDWMSNR